MSEFGTVDGVASEQLCGYVSRVERIEETIDGFNQDKKEIYAEAKSVGFDVPTLKKVIQRRRRSKADVQEADEMLDLYEQIIRSFLSRKNEVDPLA